MRRRLPAQAAVEFALTVPVLLLLILGVVDAGRGVVAAISLNNAAREGARYVAVHLNDGTCGSVGCQSEAQTIVDNTAQGIDTSQISFTLSTSGGIVSLALTCPFQPVSPMIEATFGRPTLVASTTMRAR